MSATQLPPARLRRTARAPLLAALRAPVENLYTYIFRKAWDMLDDLAQHVLRAMPLASGQGKEMEFIAAMASLAPAQVLSTFQHLHRLNLARLSGDVQQQRYSSHSFTRTFLQQQVARWL